MTIFNNDQLLKDELLAKLKHHQDLDTFTKGKWLTDEKVEGNGFKGCFYGCTMQTTQNPISKFSEKYHVDLWYCHLTENIFENLPDGHYQKFPYQSIEVLPLNFDFNKFKSKWLKTTLLKQLDWVTNEKVITLIKNTAQLFEVDFDKITEDAATSAEYAAKYAAKYAEYAVRSAVWSAEYAAKSAMSAEYAGDSAMYAGKSAARDKHYIYLKELLLEMVKEN
jgi:hypothetical protein